MVAQLLFALVLLLQSTVPPAAQGRGQVSPEEQARRAAQADALRAMLAAARKRPVQPVEIRPTPPAADWEMGMTSWVASDKNGLIYLLQRGDKADPVIVMNRDGAIVRSWGRGMYTMPHAIRVDPQGNVWTTDAASSMVYKFSADGRKLLEIAVGGQPSPCPNNFCSTTDIAFAKNGHLFIADGYRNARILEYSADGRKLNEWGKAGTGPGEFVLPHSIQVDERGVVYVADRENGRVQYFESSGKYLGEFDKYGKTFGLKIAGRSIWLATQPRNVPNLSPGWLIEVDTKTGGVKSYVDVTGAHGMDVMAN